MSLQLAAQHLQKHGRNGDTMLVHMSPREVKSLSDLAMAHGGHLTINPTTGLPEAGFLSSILPMIAGVGLTAITGGAINPMTAGLLVGGVTGVASGSLSKGLMAGLGAYGGAGLGEALAMSGVEAAAPDALANAQQVQNIVRPEAFYEAGTTNLTPAGQAYVNQVQSTINPTLAQQDIARRAYETGGFTDRLGTMGQGVKSLGSEGGIGRFYENLGNVPGTYGAKTTLAAAAAPMISEAMQPESAPKPQEDKDLGQRYVYEPGRLQGPYTASPTGIEQQYFSPSYRKVSAEEAKNVFGFAGGGPVEFMSSENAIGANTGYPMADINKPVYASPWQTPVSTNVVHGVSDTGVNPITGEMTFADGGQVPEPGEPTKYSYDPTKQMFNKIESMPSDDQTRQATEKAAQQRVGGINTPMTDAQFAAQKAQGEKNAESLGNFADAIGQGFMGFLTSKPWQLQLLESVADSLGFGSTPGQATMAPGPAVGSQGPTPGQAVEGAKMGIFGGGRGGANPSSIGIGPTGVNASAGTATSTSNGNAAAARGGLMGAYTNSHLGDYSDGGRLLRGPGDGVSDSIPAMIGKKQPARLADGEFVVPARIVSELGNGSTEAGARKLYAMMDRVQKARGQTVGKGKVAKNSRAERFLPA